MIPGPSERAGFIDAPVIGPPNMRVQADGAADRDRGRLADRPRVGRDGHDHEHQEEGEDASQRNAWPSRAARKVAPTFAMLPSEARRIAAAIKAPASWAAQ